MIPRGLKQGLRLLGFFVVIVVVLLPFLWVLSTSLKGNSEIFAFPPRWIPDRATLENYRYVLTRTNIPRQLLNSLAITAGTIALTLLIAVPGGYGFSKAKFKGKQGLLLLIFATQMVTGLGSVIAIYTMAVRLQLLNSHAFLVVLYTSMAVPFAVWYMKGFFDQMPWELEEAAMLDGCGRFRAMILVMAPLMKPAILSTAIFTFVTAWNEYFFSFVLVTRTKLKTFPVGICVFIQEYGMQWGYITATAVIGVVPIVGLYLLLNKHFMDGATEGAVR